MEGGESSWVEVKWLACWGQVRPVDQDRRRVGGPEVMRSPERVSRCEDIVQVEIWGVVIRKEELPI